MFLYIILYFYLFFCYPFFKSAFMMIGFGNLQLITLIIILGIALCELILLLMLVIQFAENNVFEKHVSYFTFQSMASIFSFGAFFCVSVFDVLHCYFSYKYGYPMFSSKYPINIMLFCGDLSVAVAYLCLSIVLYLKVYIPFRNTIYHVHPCCQLFFVILGVSSLAGIYINIYTYIIYNIILYLCFYTIASYNIFIYVQVLLFMRYIFLSKTSRKCIPLTNNNALDY